jgi:hypothetical protein
MREHERQHEVMWSRLLLLPSAVCVILLLGGVLRAWGDAHAATVVWTIGLAATGLPIVWRTLREVGHGAFATDVVATLAILVAALQQQHVAGLVIVLMQSGGEAL